MKNLKCIALTLLLLFGAMGVNASDFSNLDIKNVGINETVEIDLRDGKIDPNTVSNENIIVFNSNTREKVSVNIKLDIAQEKIVIEPLEDYEYGTEYFVQMANLKHLDEEYKHLDTAYVRAKITTEPIMSEIPDESVVIGENGFSLNYANSDKNRRFITNLITKLDGDIYIKMNGRWFTNDKRVIDKSFIPVVGYIDEKGFRLYAKGDGAVTDEKEEVPSITTDEVFSREDLPEYFNTEWARVEGKELIFNYGNTNHVDIKIKGELIPDLDKKMYEIVEHLLKNNHYGNYIKAFYSVENELGTDRTGIVVEGSKEHATYKYSIKFEDQKPNKFNDSIMNIELRHFGDSEKFSEGVKKGLSQKELDKIWYYDEVYINNFKKCIEIIFSDRDYEQIYDYIMHLYSYKSVNLKNEVKEKKVIDGVTIWVDHNFEKDGSLMNIYFKF